MRQLTCLAFRLNFLWGGILLLGMPPAMADEIRFPPSSVPDPVRVMEHGGGGSRCARAAQEFEQARQLAAAGDARCVDWFFLSALTSWEDLTEGLTQQPPTLLLGSLRLYNSAVHSCVITGHRLGRLDPAVGLKVSLDDQWHTIPIVSKGLVWRLDQIDCFRHAATCFQNPNFACTVRHGVGAALLGIHYRRGQDPIEEHYMEEHPLAITAVLRGGGQPESSRLEIYDPVHIQTIDIAGRELMLSSNIAAAVEFAVTHLEAEVNPWTAFFNPETALNYEGLLLFQPYQPGKIPLVLVHGLLSNPATWGPMINDFYNNPELMEHFQIWAYLYPTGVPFIQTAADFRQDLRNTLFLFDPGEQDPALQHMVLVGHSMGGLLSRLQVTWSGDYLWNEFAEVPFGQIRGTAELRRTLSEIFFFGPQPFVKRVVFIAVPHRGSSMSARFAGIVGRMLAGQPTFLQMLWRELRRFNPGVLRGALRMGIPSSVDGLSPNSPSLRGIAKLPFAPWVRLHSIIGTGGCEPCCPGDGVVPIESARLPGVESELFIDTTHNDLKEHPRAIREVERILWIHRAEFQQQVPRNAPDPVISIPAPSPTE